ncbi:uncharacterized protein MYCGRDRAFT_107599 [Zymoseptoria tritici IPO323]|uniref:Uncharacterized protein n=1 Tax=Zymoseptoria tritici (strain CBS 115943 / IPO323) TaxID=336722 RepID=F9WYD8_ZYMTI|nr:uncharacterized protein MYCGRDRAFT_107599 [Zymoseptoria tritici IPO323]EGP91605.1 hypothetical protein MYCGRDRAFT_107599 [Zymoseptoria tritici IPO323]
MAATGIPVMTTLSMCHTKPMRFRTLPCDQLPLSVQSKNAALVGSQSIPTTVPTHSCTGVDAPHGNLYRIREVDVVCIEYAGVDSDGLSRSDVLEDVEVKQRSKFALFFKGLRRVRSAPDLGTPPLQPIGVRERTKAIGVHLNAVRGRFSERITTLLRKRKDSGYHSEVEEPRVPLAVRVDFGHVDFGRTPLARTENSVSPSTRFPPHGDDSEVPQSLLQHDSVTVPSENPTDNGSTMAHHETSPPIDDESSSLASTRSPVDDLTTALYDWCAAELVLVSRGHDGRPFYGYESPPPVNLFAEGRGFPRSPSPRRQTIEQQIARAGELYRLMKLRIDEVHDNGGFDEDRVEEYLRNRAESTTGRAP